MVNTIIGLIKDSKSSEGDGIDSEEAKRSPLSPGFSLVKGIQKTWRQQRS